MNKNVLFNKANRSIRLSKISNSKQKNDLTLPPNCDGFGRIHHFKQNNPSWNNNPLPQNPIASFFGIEEMNELRVQVFQIAKCNFDCWYCFVDKELRNASSERSKLVTVEKMINSTIDNGLNVIDLSGGQPDLVPQWSLWILRSIKELGLDREIFVWQDDNLGNNNLFNSLSSKELKELASYDNYARVGCFKGFDKESFSFNSGMPSRLFETQFEVFSSLIDCGFEMYAYVTFTCENLINIEARIMSFVKKLMEINKMLPLRTIPLEIMHFSPMGIKLNHEYNRALENQYTVLEYWNNTLSMLYTTEELNSKISKIELVKS